MGQSRSFGSFFGKAARSETLSPDMLQLRHCWFLSLSCSFICFTFLLPADGQTGGGGARGGGGVETIQVMFTPTICKVRCSQDRCVNYCERGNVTTVFSSAEGGGRRDGSHGPGFRVCKSKTELFPCSWGSLKTCMCINNTE